MAGGRNTLQTDQGLTQPTTPPENQPNLTSHPVTVGESGLAIEHLRPGVINAARKMQMRGENLKGRTRVAGHPNALINATF